MTYLKGHVLRIEERVVVGRDEDAGGPYARDPDNAIGVVIQFTNSAIPINLASQDLVQLLHRLERFSLPTPRRCFGLSFKPCLYLSQKMLDSARPVVPKPYVAQSIATIYI